METFVGTKVYAAPEILRHLDIFISDIFFV